jgi:predicted metallopeptidase
MKRFTNINSDEELINNIIEYIKFINNKYNIGININNIVDYQVVDIIDDKELTGACVESYTKNCFQVGKKPNSEHLNEDILTDDPRDNYKECILKVSFEAFKELSDEECKEIIRHELIHVYQNQEYGISNHGDEFKKLSNRYECSVECSKFREFKYEIYCSSCNDLKYESNKETQIINNAKNSKSICCESDFNIISNY